MNNVLADAMRAEPVTTPAEVRSIEVITAEIWVLKAQVGGGLVDIGNRLLEAKAQLPHGEWLPWLEEKAEFSISQANRFMRLAKEYSNSSPVTNLGTRKALALLAFEPEDRDAFAAESHVVNGEEKTVEDMTAKELEQAIRERKEALEAKEAAEAEKRIAEQSRDKMAQDMALAKSLLETAQEESQAAEDRVASLRMELEDLRKRPTEIVGTAVPDKAALEAAREEGAAAAKVETDQALKEKLEKAMGEAKAARDKLKEIRDSARETETRSAEENKALAERISILEKQLKVSGNKTLASFHVYFETVQEDFCKMLGHLQKIKLAGDVEDHDKLVDATHKLLASLADKVPGKAGGADVD